MSQDIVCKHCGQQITKSKGAQCLTRKNQPCSGWTGGHRKHMNTKTYFAYGTDIENVTYLYPNAKKATIPGYRLIFTGERGVASISPSRFNSYVEGVLYTTSTPLPLTNGQIQSAMDVCLEDGSFKRVLVNIQHSTNLSCPTEEYVLNLHAIYKERGFNMKHLEDALDKSTY